MCGTVGVGKLGKFKKAKDRSSTLARMYSTAASSTASPRKEENVQKVLNICLQESGEEMPNEMLVRTHHEKDRLESGV